ncbi:fibrinogen-like protein A [Apostichopus japonicus]|uniref:Fibrinogen-like protein A n=1 Tax=Stichopus japonicus TaxID=307972 RepID=A0A2G8JHE8_STIJA|nr:fibrinogen-like protein A [Apostichopus japonicus]
MTFTIWMLVIILEVSAVTSTQIRDDTAGRRSSRARRSVYDGAYFVYDSSSVTYPRDCAEVYDKCNMETSGIFLIQPDDADEPFIVYCNNSIDGGKWTVFQRRTDGSVEFYRSWNEYKNGFGFLQREFWLGNDKISLLTNQKDYELRIDITVDDGTPYYAKYTLFRISDELSKYRLVSIGGFDTSTIVHDRLSNHLNHSFTTYDSDNDNNINGNSAEFCRGAWWYSGNCQNVDGDLSNLNGMYFPGSSGFMSIYWDDIDGGSGHQINLKYVEMKIRPRATP